MSLSWSSLKVIFLVELAQLVTWRTIQCQQRPHSGSGSGDGRVAVTEIKEHQGKQRHWSKMKGEQQLWQPPQRVNMGNGGRWSWRPGIHGNQESLEISRDGVTGTCRARTSGLSGVVAARWQLAWQAGELGLGNRLVRCKSGRASSHNGSSKRRRLKSRALHQRKQQQAKKQQELLPQRRQLRPRPLQQDVAGEPQGEAEQSHEEEQSWEKVKESGMEKVWEDSKEKPLALTVERSSERYARLNKPKNPWSWMSDIKYMRVVILQTPVWSTPFQHPSVWEGVREVWWWALGGENL